MKFFLSIFLIYFLFINTAKSEQTIAFIDMDRIISTSNSGSSIFKQLNNINNKNLKFLKTEEEKFKKKEAKLISQKNIISEEDFNTKVVSLKSEIKDYNENRKKIITSFNKLKIDSTNKLLVLTNPIIIKFSQDKKLSIILQKKNLVIGIAELDITDEIIKIMNDNIKDFKIK
tara:strand:- start:72 stop:590 length:519 start_codon:yes stop_codon:yes gene_type:complete